MQIQPQYAPRPADTRAILRAKSLLGETYMELTPGTQRSDAARWRDAPAWPGGADRRSSTRSCRRSIPQTRRAFLIWQQQDGIALTGRGQDFNAAFAELFPFATNVDSGAGRAAPRQRGHHHVPARRRPGVLGAQRIRRHSFRDSSATRTPRSPRRPPRDMALANTIEAFPPFTVQARSTINRLNEFAVAGQAADRRVAARRPRQLSPALQQTRDPGARAARPDESTSARCTGCPSKTGVPALERFLDQSVPWLARPTPYLGGWCR